MSKKAESFESDVAIIGAGPAGLLAAILFTRLGFSAIAADTAANHSASAAKGRSAALLNRTVKLLERAGVWGACLEVAAPLKTLQFIDDTGRRFRAPDCAFSASEIGEDAFGYNIANADLVGILRREADRLGLRLINPGRLQSLQTAGKLAQAAFEDGTTAQATLVIAADGRMSAARNAAGIRALSWTYDQTAIATSFSHELAHHGTCIELHRRAGPFTLVPLKGKRSSLVWVERNAEAARLMSLEPESFSREIETVSRFALGRVLDLSERAHFPLSSLAAREYGRDRVALVGEAAHVTPPIGAQGLNLGFRDVEELANLAAAARARGEDIGGETLLCDYSRARRGDIMSRTLGVDALNRSLLSDLLPFQLARGAGLYALGAIGPLRRAFMRHSIAPRSAI